MGFADVGGGVGEVGLAAVGGGVGELGFADVGGGVGEVGLANAEGAVGLADVEGGVGALAPGNLLKFGAETVCFTGADGAGLCGGAPAGFVGPVH